MIVYLALTLVALLFTSISQVLLKIGSQQKNTIGPHLSPYLNVYTISAYAIFLLITLVSVIALQEIPLKLFNALTSLNFVFVALLSWVMFKEKITGNMIIAIVLICLGTIIFNI